MADNINAHITLGWRTTKGNRRRAVFVFHLQQKYVFLMNRLDCAEALHTMVLTLSWHDQQMQFYPLQKRVGYDYSSGEWVYFRACVSSESGEKAG